MVDKKIIDLFQRKAEKEDPVLVQAIDHLAGLPDDMRQKIISFIGASILMQVDEGLGTVGKGDFDLVELTEGVDYFQEINDKYNASRGDCYFCDQALNAGGHPFTVGVDPVCGPCVEKIASFFEALGGDPDTIRNIFSEADDDTETED